MDELKIKSPVMRQIVGRAVTRYLKKKGIDIEISVNDVDGVSSSEDGSTTIRADITVHATKAQLIKFLG